MGITATKNDIVENPHNVEIVEAEAAQLPNVMTGRGLRRYQLQQLRYQCRPEPREGLPAAIEGSASAYGNILCVKEGNETAPKILALKAALESKQVADFIAEKYAGSVVVSVVENPH